VDFPRLHSHPGERLRGRARRAGRPPFPSLLRPFPDGDRKYPLVLLSHGTGGSAFSLAWLAEALARKGYKDGGNFFEVPAFWEAIMKDGRWNALWAKADFEGMGVCGVCRDFDMASGTFVYGIAIDEPPGIEGMPSGSEVFEIPASTWGKFTSRGPLRPNFQVTIKRAFGEWLPGIARLLVRVLDTTEVGQGLSALEYENA